MGLGALRCDGCDLYRCKSADAHFAIGLEGGTGRPLFGLFWSSNACCTALYCYPRSALRWSISGFVGIMTWPSDTLAGTVVTPRRFRVLLRCWPVQPGADSDGDPRGRGCALYADCRYSLVEPSDLDRVFCILYEGQPRVCRVAGELVNLSRACALSCLMLGSPYPPGALEALAACARYLCGPAFTSDLAARARAAGELGPPCRR